MSIRSLAAAGAAALVTAFAAAPSQAAVIASLSFDQPTGIVAPGDSVDVFFTLTLDAGSDALITDGSGAILSGFSEDEILDLGGDPMAPGAHTYINVFFQCGDTFTNCFSGAPYDFTFNTGGDDDFNAPRNLTLNPGESRSVRYGTFTPTGATPSGAYSFFNAGVTLNFFAGGLAQPLSRTIAETCPTQAASCSFTRTVVGGAVPEPSAWALMILGFGAAGSVMRRQRAAAAERG